MPAKPVGAHENNIVGVGAAYASRAAVSILIAAATAIAQHAVEPGSLPGSWITGGPNCLEVPDWQIHEYNTAFYILRESGCINYEKPFLVQRINAKKGNLPLVVAHTHGHSDHVQGDKGFDGMAHVTVIAAAVPAMQKAFGIDNRPTQIGAIDLGDRVIDREKLGRARTVSAIQWRGAVLLRDYDPLILASLGGNAGKRC